MTDGETPKSTLGASLANARGGEALAKLAASLPPSAASKDATVDDKDLEVESASFSSTNNTPTGTEEDSLPFATDPAELERIRKERETKLDETADRVSGEFATQVHEPEAPKPDPVLDEAKKRLETAPTAIAATPVPPAPTPAAAPAPTPAATPAPATPKRKKHASGAHTIAAPVAAPVASAPAAAVITSSTPIVPVAPTALAQFGAWLRSNFVTLVIIAIGAGIFAWIVASYTAGVDTSTAATPEVTNPTTPPVTPGNELIILEGVEEPTETPAKTEEEHLFTGDPGQLVWELASDVDPETCQHRFAGVPEDYIPDGTRFIRCEAGEEVGDNICNCDIGVRIR